MSGEIRAEDVLPSWRSIRSLAVKETALGLRSGSLASNSETSRSSCSSRTCVSRLIERLFCAKGAAAGVRAQAARACERAWRDFLYPDRLTRGECFPGDNRSVDGAFPTKALGEPFGRNFGRCFLDAPRLMRASNIVHDQTR